LDRAVSLFFYAQPSFSYWLRPIGLAFAAAHPLTGCALSGLHSQPLILLLAAPYRACIRSRSSMQNDPADARRYAAHSADAAAAKRDDRPDVLDAESPADQRRIETLRCVRRHLDQELAEVQNA